jgi:hypothetical protein
MTTDLSEIIYRGNWRGLGEMYNIKVENGYTTIIVLPGQNLKQRAKETREKFAARTKAASRRST